MTRDQQRRAALVLAHEAIHAKFLGAVEDYLFIGGDRMSARRAAERLGFHPRTVQRIRAYLRRAEDREAA